MRESPSLHSSYSLIHAALNIAPSKTRSSEAGCGHHHHKFSCGVEQVKFFLIVFMLNVEVLSSCK